MFAASQIRNCLSHASWSLLLSHQPSLSTIVQKVLTLQLLQNHTHMKQMIQSLLLKYTYHSFAYMLPTQCTNREFVTQITDRDET